MESAATPRIQPWMRGFLLLAVGYHILWGVLISQFPEAFYQWVSRTDQAPNLLVTYQGYGVLLMALVYLCAGLYPTRLWFLPGIGAFSKLFGAIGFWYIIMEQQVTKRLWFHILINDLVWVPVLLYISWQAKKIYQAQA